jgi:hypothetical protein
MIWTGLTIITRNGIARHGGSVAGTGMAAENDRGGSHRPDAAPAASLQLRPKAREGRAPRPVPVAW